LVAVALEGVRDPPVLLGDIAQRTAQRKIAPIDANKKGIPLLMQYLD
jgi:hypothetical protein